MPFQFASVNRRCYSKSCVNSTERLLHLSLQDMTESIFGTLMMHAIVLTAI